MTSVAFFQRGSLDYLFDSIFVFPHLSIFRCILNVFQVPEFIVWILFTPCEIQAFPVQLTPSQVNDLSDRNRSYTTQPRRLRGELLTSF